MIRRTSMSEESSNPLPVVERGDQNDVPEVMVDSSYKGALPAGMDSRPISRTTLGGSSIRTSYLALDPFDSFKVDDLTNYAMNDQRWTLQRKKIGLKRKTSGTRERKVRNKQIKEINLNFIRENFKRKECFQYCKDYLRGEIVGKEVCRCGLVRYEHEIFKPNEVVSKHIQKLPPLDAQHTQGFQMDKMLKLPFLNGKVAPLKPSIEPLRSISEGKILAEEEETEPKEETILKEQNAPIERVLLANGITPRSSQRDKQHLISHAPKRTFSREAVQEFLSSKKKWSQNNVMREFPTNAFGKIDFVNETLGTNKPAKYVRITDDADIKTVISLLTDYWRLLEPTRPHLIISVIGGAKNFRLDGKKKEIFNSSLIRAVKSTHAWILTGGMHVGVTKIVGEAVQEGQYVVKVKRKSFFAEERDHMVRGIKCIGLAPWGYIKDRESLINSDLNDFPTIKYKVEESIEKHKNVSLNGNHTHFLLIDNGIRNRYSGADRFRQEL